ncbi:zinc finger, C3HC4 type (RING finger) protein (macronuclear) [Tetrahymena thermophila SB210]|uniref:Zinc finger, C3HC4 type (RING finger) protein n=1 Tax=Tetrahymena thermophila (strain SB210) TaxID=312017 RepID=Q24E43_TETTS|nr:zinc finger, C3HC4 type (RING finger) protein [Tetrahymena thermophila SB210]EAS06058.2 zinc finger, C3HC4 type (RING finger) protein [Tetrahymena thermophila SB210]|eukprot:XP_001026303.2 zinc finger, C3HC4 type (RING finger) protein [Tetrahymena thermophila SB210]
MVIYPAYNTQKVFYFAEQLHEVIFLGDEDPYYQLSRKERIKKRYWYIDIILTIGDLTLAILGVVFFSINDYFRFMLSLNKTEGFSDDCQFSSAWIMFWSIVLLCISRKNAFQLVLIAIISMPFIVCLLPIKLMKQNKQKRIKNLQCLKIIQSFKYHPNTLQGDEHSCSICRIDYALGVNIKILPCSSLHHFHSNCIKTWFKISPSCPLCRKELGKIIDDIRSTNGAPSYLVLDNQNFSQVNNDLESQENNGQNNQIQNENQINQQQNQSNSQINSIENQQN